MPSKLLGSPTRGLIYLGMPGRRRDIVKGAPHSEHVSQQQDAARQPEPEIHLMARQFSALVVAPVVTAALVMPAATQPQPAGDSLPQMGNVAIMRPLRSQDIAGRWGLVAYHRDRDRAHAEAVATRQCRRHFFRRGVTAYEIRAAGAVVMMHNHDEPNPREMIVKANSAGQTFIGPGPDPGGIDDREIVSYDGHVMILRWLDPKVGSMYGIMLYVRCAPGQTPPPLP